MLLHTTKLSSLQNLRFLNPKLGKLNKVLRFAQKKQECFLLRRQLASERYYLIYFSARFPYKGLLNYAHSYLIKEENNETNRLPLGLRFCFLMVGGSTQKQKRSFLWLCNKLLKGREVGIWILKNKFCLSLYFVAIHAYNTTHDMLWASKVTDILIFIFITKEDSLQYYKQINTQESTLCV